MSSVFYRSKKPYPVAVRGEGAYLIDEHGRRYLDGASGALVANLGHGNARIADAMRAQALTLPFVHGSQFTSPVLEAYAARLAGLLSTPGYRFWAVSGGSEATESAIKLARQYHAERGDTGRYKIITRRPSYHGASLGSLAASGMGARRELYTPLMNDAAWPKMPKPDPQLDGREDARRLEAVIQEAGAGTVAAFMAEPVVGASDAALAPNSGYYAEIAAICARHGMLFIADEVMTGLGRAGSLFATAQWATPEWNGTPDIVVLGKGLAAGYAPLAGLLASPDVYDTVMGGSGAFKHGFTYAGHPVSVAAGAAALDILQEQDLVTRSATLGTRLLDGLRDLQREAPAILEVRGRGLMLGLVLGDPDTGEAYAAPGIAERVGRAAMAAGLITYPGSGAVDGVRGDHLLLGPPLTLQDTEADELLALLREAFRTA
ncbi:aspartate aminotransferase family protein [Deinococcus maricopensis]|uniref:Acetylornithine transaminase n=1 Tax=Deinococcus maricopensis (strain DSM 21211 / LMG 22137 / NRRL B-23946 / LB-34) TaxID=709986 RepID=E8U994_DEIML|nr:aminotransferase class III-fold pyridoxal phosphate-dependent enzyme [Deinococcus maricopensis]ADV67633.1 Acetylornithine transaminase [Deinococcus maricopensis DSM 21211]